jgi:hypothetical protein
LNRSTAAPVIQPALPQPVIPQPVTAKLPDRFSTSTAQAAKPSSANKENARKIMARMAEVAEPYARNRYAERKARGEKATGLCLNAVMEVLDGNRFPGHKVPNPLTEAYQFAEKVDAKEPGYYGLEKIKAPSSGPGTVDLTAVPPGAIIVVAAGAPGTSHPTAGDISIKGNGKDEFFNDHAMSYGDATKFPAGKLLGIYVPTGADIGEVDFNRTTEASVEAATSSGRYGGQVGGGEYMPTDTSEWEARSPYYVPSEINPVEPFSQDPNVNIPVIAAPYLDQPYFMEMLTALMDSGVDWSAVLESSDFEAWMQTQEGCQGWKKGDPVTKVMIAKFLAKKLSEKMKQKGPLNDQKAKDIINELTSQYTKLPASRVARDGISKDSKITNIEDRSGKQGNAQDAIRFFMSKGLSREQAAGVAGNLSHESNFRPDAVGDHGTSFGIAQWHKERGDNMKRWTKANGYDPKSFRGQLEFLWHELNTNERGALTALKGSSSAYDAGMAFCRHFERPAYVDPERGRTAEKFLNSGNV